MFFSTNSSTKNGHDPFSLPPPPLPPPDPDHSFHLPISFFPFPSPFEVDDHEYNNDDDLYNFTTNYFNNVIPSPPPTTTTTPTDLDKNPTNTTTTTTTTATIMNSDEKKKIPRKRLSKKDRHSKITTARGLRDRRMRLSLPVARQFFGLQDMLGVDKGSKTVEWLLIQARPEISKLARERNCSSLQIMSTTTTTTVLSSNNSNSEGDMVSGIDEAGVGAVDHDENLSSFKKDIKKKKIIRAKQPRKTMAKELRAMARERARTRTMEKIKNQITDCSVSDFDINHHHHHQPNNNLTKIPSCSWSSPFETGEESGGTTHSYNNLNPAIEVQSSDQPIIDHCQIFQHFSSFEIMAKWSPSDSTLNYLHQTETLDHHLHQEQHEFENSDIFG